MKLRTRLTLSSTIIVVTVIIGMFVVEEFDINDLTVQNLKTAN